MDDKNYSRRDFMAMAGVGGLVFASGLPGCASTGFFSTPATPWPSFGPVS